MPPWCAGNTDLLTLLSDTFGQGKITLRYAENCKKYFASVSHNCMVKIYCKYRKLEKNNNRYDVCAGMFFNIIHVVS